MRIHLLPIALLTLAHAFLNAGESEQRPNNSAEISSFSEHLFEIETSLSAETSRFTAE